LFLNKGRVGKQVLSADVLYGQPLRLFAMRKSIDGHREAQLSSELATAKRLLPMKMVRLFSMTLFSLCLEEAR